MIRAYTSAMVKAYIRAVVPGWNGEARIVLNTGQFIVTGNDALLQYGFIPLGKGEYLMSGNSMSLLAGRLLALGKGEFALTGKDSVLTYTGGTPSVLSDGNTVAWYEIGDGSATYLTKDGSNYVSQWTDQSGSGNHLVQATGTNQPLYSADGVLFDGVDNIMKTGSFTYNSPQHIYLVVKQNTWSIDKGIICGLASSSMLLYQANISGSPNVAMFSGTNLPSTKNDKLAVNEWGILRLLFNTANSSFTVNEETPFTGSIATATSGGIIFGAWFNSTKYGNVQFKEAIFRKVADNSTDETAIYNYLKTKYSL